MGSWTLQRSKTRDAARRKQALKKTYEVPLTRTEKLRGLETLAFGLDLIRKDLARQDMIKADARAKAESYIKFAEHVLADAGYQGVPVSTADRDYAV